MNKIGNDGFSLKVIFFKVNVETKKSPQPVNDIEYFFNPKNS
jgi:hypothetical protein